jgi:hypothetical protein
MVLRLHELASRRWQLPLVHNGDSAWSVKRPSGATAASALTLGFFMGTPN